MPNEFVIQAPTNSLQLNEQRQAEFTYNVFNASGRPLRAQAIIRTTPPGGEAWFSFEPAERDFPISHSEQYKLQISVPPTTPAGSYTFAMDMLWEGAGEPEQRTVAGQSVTFEVPKPQPKGTPWWVYALAGGGLLVIIAVVVVVILSNRTVTVPELGTVTADQARTALEKAGLKMKEPVAEEYSDTVPAGVVISYEPGMDEKVKPGTEISVTISLGAAEFAIPGGLAKETEEEARAKLDAVCSPQPCFNVIVKRENSQQVGIDQVIRTEPGEGEKVARGADVTLVVSNGFTYSFKGRIATMDIFTYPATFTCGLKLPIWKLDPIPLKIIATPVPQVKATSPVIKDWIKILNLCPDFVKGPDLILTNQIQKDVFYPGMIAIRFDLSEIKSVGELEQATLSLYLKSLGKGTTNMDVYVSAAMSDWSDKSNQAPDCSKDRTHSVKVSTAGKYYNFDLKELTANYSKEIANYGLCVMSTDEDLVTFGSSEGAANQRPALSGIYRK